MLPEDVAALERPPAGSGVRLLPPHDPYSAQRDRETLVPDPAVRKRVWRPIAGPGTVLVDGVLAGLWRASRRGKRLVVTVEELGPSVRAAEEAVVEEVRLLAPWRGAETAVLAWAD